MEYIEKAALSQSKKRRNIVKISVVGAICAVGFILACFSVYLKSYMYAALYLVAVVLGLAYVIIKINTVMPAYIAADSDTIYLQCWDNGAFPYKINFKPAFLADFVPAKVQKKEIPISDIKSMMIGSKNYLVRNLEETDFAKQISDIAKSRHTEHGAIRKMDFVCIVDKNDNVFFMPVTDMEPNSLARVVNLVHRKNEDVQIKCNLRQIRSRLTV